MKRFISLSLVVFILLSLFTQAALAEEIYGLAIMKISTRSGPSTSYRDMGTYDLEGRYLRILSRAYDDVNGIWWVQCVIPSNGLALWTGYKRFDHSTLPLEIIPIEGQDAVESDEIYGRATMKISTRSGPSTKYEDTGTYDLAGQYLRILARAYDRVNEIWWVKCIIPSNGRALWTGYKRFDPSQLPLDIIPIEVW